MSAFLSKLVVEQVDTEAGEGRGSWQLVQPLVYRSASLSIELTVPIGFITDFASVPRVPFVFDWLGDRGHLAATLHDWLYSTPHPLPHREAADDILYEALLAQGVGEIEATLIYEGVRIGGGSHYD